MTSIRGLLLMLCALSVVGCKNPLAGDQASTEVGADYQPGLALNPFKLEIPFDAGTEGDYAISDATRVEFVDGVVRLKSSQQTDDESSATPFGGGTMTGVQWDAVKGVVRLQTTTNNAELDSSWAPRADRLVGAWSLNGSGAIANNATVAASAGSALTALNANGTGLAYVPGRLKQGISFDGVDDALSSTSASLRPASVTISMWVNLSTIAPAVQLFGGYGSTGLNGYIIGYESSKYFFRVGNGTVGGASYGAQSKSAIVANQWIHLVGTYSSGTTRLYVNGQLESTNTLMTGDIAYTGMTRFLLGNVEGLPATRYTNGILDEVAVWNAAIDPADVRRLYQRQSAKYAGLLTSRVMDGLTGTASWTDFSVRSTLPFQKELPGPSSETATDYPGIRGNLMNGLDALYHMNESSAGSAPGGKDLIDSSGNGHHMTLMGSGGEWNAPSPLRGGFNMNGNGNVYLASSSGAYFTGAGLLGTSAAWSFSFWIRPTASPKTAFGNSSFVIGNWLNNSCRPCFYYDSYSFSGAAPVVSFRESGGAGNIASLGLTPSKFVPNQWTHVAVTFDGVDLVAYVNGRRDTSVQPPFAPAWPAGEFLIGSYQSGGGTLNNGSRFPGAVDEVALWKRALVGDEVVELYRRGANRLKHQIRTCTSSDCSDQEASATKGWKGPDGTNQTYFSELNNTANNAEGAAVGTAAPVMTFANFGALGLTSRRYFQYRSIFESDDELGLCDGETAPCSPELKSVSVGPTHYDSAMQTVTSHAALTRNYKTLRSFVETLGAGGCPSGARYALSPDGNDFYVWSSVSNGWVKSDGTYTAASPGTDLSAHIASFPTVAGVGVLRVKTFLKSDGTSKCEVAHLLFSGQGY